MADEKKPTSEEITDEQANEAAGGAHYHVPRIQRDSCYLCKKTYPVDDLLYQYIDKELRPVCFKCAGVR